MVPCFSKGTNRNGTLGKLNLNFQVHSVVISALLDFVADSHTVPGVVCVKYWHLWQNEQTWKQERHCSGNADVPDKGHPCWSRIYPGKFLSTATKWKQDTYYTKPEFSYSFSFLEIQGEIECKKFRWMWSKGSHQDFGKLLNWKFRECIYIRD